MTSTPAPIIDVPARGRRPDLRYVAAGALVAGGRRFARLAGTAAGATQAVARPVTAVASSLVPAPLRHAVLDTAAGLEQQGRSAARSGAEATAQLAAAVCDRLARDPLLVRFVGDLVEQMQGRAIDTFLPAVLERLASEPDQVREIIAGQSLGMAEELRGTARARAVAGDEAVDRLMARLLRRPARRRDAPERRVRGDVAPADGPRPDP
jgi:hypothetical protein